MPGRNKRSTPKRRQVPKILSTAKVLRVVQELGADPAKFLRLYAEDRTRTRKEAAPPSREQVAAVTAFTKDGSVASLMKSTGLKTPAAALNLVGRVNRHAKQKKS